VTSLLRAQARKSASRVADRSRRPFCGSARCVASNAGTSTARSILCWRSRRRRRPVRSWCRRRSSRSSAHGLRAVAQA